MSSNFGAALGQVRKARLDKSACPTMTALRCHTERRSNVLCSRCSGLANELFFTGQPRDEIRLTLCETCFGRVAQYERIQAHLSLCGQCTDLVLELKRPVFRIQRRAWAWCWRWLWCFAVCAWQRRPAYQSIECPRCRFEFDWHSPPWFRCDRGGVQPSTPDGPEVHWFEGIQTCPRCRFDWWVGDSS